MKIVSAGIAFLIGFGAVAMANSAEAAPKYKDICKTGARVLCKAPVLPVKPPAKKVPSTYAPTNFYR